MKLKIWIVICVVITLLVGCTQPNTPESVSTSAAPLDESAFFTTPVPSVPPAAAPLGVDVDSAILLSDPAGQLFLFDSATRARYPLSAPGVYLPTVMSQWAHLIAPVRLSPQATQLVIPQPAGGPTWLLDLSTAIQSQLADQALSVTWASDGRQIAFYTPDILAPETLYTQQVSPALQPARPLAHVGGKIIAAAWSPTDAHIAVAVSTGELAEGAAAAYVEIMLVAVETGAVQSLGLIEAPLTSASAWDLVWTTDGREIWHLPAQAAFSLDARVFRPLPARPAPVSARVQAVAPDGARLAYVAADQRTLWITTGAAETDYLPVTLAGVKSITALFWIEEQLLLTTAAPNELTSIWRVNPETGVAVELCDTVYFIDLWANLIERYTNLALDAGVMQLPSAGDSPTVVDLSEYTDVTTWEVYPLPHTSGALLAPPGWVVTEGSEMGERLYSLAFQPPVWDSPEACGYQCPVISVAVYRLAASSAPPDAVLPTWLAQRATAEPFGADVAEDVMYFNVGTPIETTLGALPALGFSHEAMGIHLYTTLAVVDDVVIAFTKTYMEQFDFQPIYDLMRAQARF